MTVEEHKGEFDGVQRDDDYLITVGAQTPRKFVGIKLEKTWRFSNGTCYYVGNTQGGRLSSEEAFGDSVIEGEYTDYIVDSLFDTQYIPFGQFDEDLCNNKSVA